MSEQASIIDLQIRRVAELIGTLVVDLEGSDDADRRHDMYTDATEGAWHALRALIQAGLLDVDELMPEATLAVATYAEAEGRPVSPARAAGYMMGSDALIMRRQDGSTGRHDEAE